MSAHLIDLLNHIHGPLTGSRNPGYEPLLQSMASPTGGVKCRKVCANMAAKSIKLFVFIIRKWIIISL